MLLRYINHLVALICLVMLTACSNSSNESPELIEFNAFLGKEKAASLDFAVETYDDFISANFGRGDTRAFLEVMNEDYMSFKDMRFDHERSIQMINQIEQSGMRKEIYVFGGEAYTPDYLYDLYPDLMKDMDDAKIFIPDTFEFELPPAFNDPEVKRIAEERRKSQMTFNQTGQFLYGLAEFGQNDRAVSDLVEVYDLVGDISPKLLIKGLLNLTDEELENPFVKRIIVMEIYFHLARRHIELSNQWEKLPEPFQRRVLLDTSN